MKMENELWFNTRLSAEHMVFLNNAIISEEQRNNREDWKENAAGNVSRCDLIDKDNWFYESVLKKLSERMFCQNWNAYRRYVIDQEEPLPKFELYSFWVNYQKKHDHVPIHGHGGLYSFVVFMKIPTHWKEQHVLPMKLKSNVITIESASDFMFVWSKNDTNEIFKCAFPLSPKDEGRILFFPAGLDHQVYPFYECEEERITISGNIRMYDPNSSKEQEIPIGVYEEKEQILEMMKKSVKKLKEELKQMKKERENDK